MAYHILVLLIAGIKEHCPRLPDFRICRQRRILCRELRILQLSREAVYPVANGLNNEAHGIVLRIHQFIGIPDCLVEIGEGICSHRTGLEIFQCPLAAVLHLRLPEIIIRIGSVQLDGKHSHLLSQVIGCLIDTPGIIAGRKILRGGSTQIRII